MRILVCGGRDYRRRACVFAVLESLDQKQRIDHVIDGGARGADSLGNEWAIMNVRGWERHPADWTRHGRAAGHVRNAFMVTLMPDLVVAFPGGRGTADMVAKSRAAGIAVMEVLE